MKPLLFLLLICLATVAAESSKTLPIFQIRLAVTADPATPAPVDWDSMKLLQHDSATGRTKVEMLYVQRKVLLDQNDLKGTSVSASQSLAQPIIEIAFTDEGRRRFAVITRDNIDRRLAIIIGGKIYAAPVIRTEIPGGQAELSGDFTSAEAENLSNSINEAIKH